MNPKLDALANTHSGIPAAVLCPGTTLAGYDDANVPTRWVRIAVEDAILKCPAAKFWLFTHTYALRDLAPSVPATTTVISSNALSGEAAKVFGADRVVGVDFQWEIAGDGDAATAGIDFARILGCKSIFTFGLDCYFTKDLYTFNARKSRVPSENNRSGAFALRHKVNGQNVWQTPRLRKQRIALGNAIRSERFDGVEVWCVGSPWSQQDAIPKLTDEEFREVVAREIDAVETGAPPAETPPADVPLPEIAGLANQDLPVEQETMTSSTATTTFVAEIDGNAPVVTVQPAADPPPFTPKRRGRPPKNREAGA